MVHMIWLILNAPYKMKYTQTLYDMRIKFSIKIDCFIYCKKIIFQTLRESKNEKLIPFLCFKF